MINMYELIVFIIMFILAGWAYLSALNISGTLVFAICVVLEFGLALTYKGKIKLRQWFLLWIPALLIMFFHADNLSASVLSYNITYLVLLLLMIVLIPAAKFINEKIPLRILAGFSIFSVVFVILEYLLPDLMRPVINGLLSGEYLTSELKALTTKTLHSGLATSSNVTTFSAVILLCYGFYYRKNDKRVTKWIVIFIALVSIVISGERSNLLFIPFSMMITYVVQGDRNKLKRGFRIIFILAALIGVVVFLEPFLSQFRLFERFFSSLSTYSSGGDISGGRLILYARAVSLWLKKTLFGNGWFYFYSNNMGILRRLTKSHAHNLILELLCDTGVLGLILMLAPIIVIYIGNYKVLKDEASKYRQIYKFTFTLQTFFLLDSMLHVTYYSKSIITIYFIVTILFLIVQGKED